MTLLANSGAWFLCWGGGGPDFIDFCFGLHALSQKRQQEEEEQKVFLFFFWSIIVVCCCCFCPSCYGLQRKQIMTANGSGISRTTTVTTVAAITTYHLTIYFAVSVCVCFRVVSVCVCVCWSVCDSYIE